MKKAAVLLLFVMITALLVSCGSSRKQARCSEPYSKVVHDDAIRV